jgi:hypothetical protein
MNVRGTDESFNRIELLRQRCWDERSILIIKSFEGLQILEADLGFEDGIELEFARKLELGLGVEALFDVI